ncbi:MAG TPA: phospholipase D-like domain-containing protein, partial [Reyranella sp.]|nr:phospholipase D-like domain-containing protein [Reyranella sp.]
MTFLRPGDNVWRIERAARAAVLVDGAAFFDAVRQSFLKARRSILIVGWDIDSRTRLVGESGKPADGYPSGFADFLGQLVATRSELHIDLLLWDYSLLYAGERELLPRLSLQWRTPERISLCLDDTVPFGCSQHQKIVVVDDAVAFSGGLDLTVRRWDTSRHDADNRNRVDPSGHPYRPFHDVQMMVDGEAAHALASLARWRWCRANGGKPSVEPVGDPWPEKVAADFTDVEVAIARTQPRYDGADGAYEVETLFLDSIDHAERSIYIENQFLTCPVIAARLARRLRQRSELEVVIVAPRSHDSWLERRTMRNGRIRFWRTLSEAGGPRVRLLYPSVEQGGRATDTMIHSKVMVVDDRFLRVGSANLNNRSMGADTECDLAIAAAGDAERAAIAAVRNRLLGEHCGATAEEVAAALGQHGSLVQAALSLAAGGHRLRPIEDGEPDDGGLVGMAEQVADPRRPLRPARLLRRVLPR